jgi:hypothetical protein
MHYKNSKSYWASLHWIHHDSRHTIDREQSSRRFWSFFFGCGDVAITQARRATTPFAPPYSPKYISLQVLTVGFHATFAAVGVLARTHALEALVKRIPSPLWFTPPIQPPGQAMADEIVFYLTSLHLLN